jgi:hypothetical protein
LRASTLPRFRPASTAPSALGADKRAWAARGNAGLAPIAPNVLESMPSPRLVISVSAQTIVSRAWRLIRRKNVEISLERMKNLFMA